MNVSELCRKLGVNKEKLFEGIEKLGFDIGVKAIQVDDKAAEKIIKRWGEIAEKNYSEEESRKKMESPLVETAEGKEKKILIPDFITVNDLADKLSLSVVKIIHELMKNGIMATINERIDFATAVIIAEDLGFKVEKGGKEEDEKKIDFKELIKEEDKKNLKVRPPVVVVVGHIDHGKTSLLDRIRKTNIAAEEAGAITQHIGAYQAEKGGRLITFIDTPGHEAFNTMRARGGKAADIAVLVIAADDKVQPQTLESIKIIEQEKLPFVVALNKVDSPKADIERIKKELAEINLIPEDWGGKTICQSVSAKTGEGIDELLEMILLLADLNKDRLLANPERNAIGTIIEAHLDKNEGPVATALVHTGTLKIGDQIFVNKIFGKVRALKDWRNYVIKEASPSMPAKILGLNGLPQVGDILEAIKDKKLLKKKIKELPEIHKKEIVEKGEVKIKKEFLKLILKADALGSLEAILESLNKIRHPEVEVKITKRGLGNITPADILEAESSRGKVLGFNVTFDSEAERFAQEKNVEIKIFKIIYDLIDWVKEELTKLLKPEIIKTVIGKLEVLAIFRKGCNHAIIGGKVKDGWIEKKRKVRINRENKHLDREGFLTQLQSNKEDVEEVREGRECGIKIEGFTDVRVGDILEIYKEEERGRKLEI